MARVAQQFFSPNRLLAAADVLLAALHPPRGGESRISMYVGPCRVGEQISPRMFTADELIEAMAMLMRMGLVPTDKPSSSAG